ncbi:MAG: Ldh family oxidoreductase [Pirellulales bacterium]
MPLVGAKQLAELSTSIFEAVGASTENARWVAEHLVQSNLSGHDSHGVIRVGQYVQAVDEGTVNPIALPTCERENLTCAGFDGHHCFGQVAVNTALEWAMTRSTHHGSATVTVNNCYHSGRLGAYTSRAAQRGLVSIMMVNAGGGGQWVTPFGGRAGRISTNPISIAAPSPSAYPLMLDIATSVVPEGKVRSHFREGKAVPKEWIVDGDGNSSDDPQSLYNSQPGALLPMGGEIGYKGFGLAVMIDVLAGALSGAGCCSSSEVSPSDGIFLIVLDPQRFTGRQDFARQVDGLIEHIKSCPTAPGFEDVYLPGELEHRTEQLRQKEGIPLSNETWTEIKQLADRFKVAQPALTGT